MKPRNRFQGINSVSLCSLAGRYDNLIPTRCLAPKDFLKIPALYLKTRFGPLDNDAYKCRLYTEKFIPDTFYDADLIIY